MRGVQTAAAQALLDAVPDAILLVDDHGTVTLANTMAAQLFRGDRQTLVGMSVDDLVPNRLRGRHAAHRADFAAAPRSRPMGSGLHLWARRLDDTEVAVEISLGPLQTESGTTVCVSIRDVTEHREAERALTQQARELSRSNADLEEFAYVASHDLQEPLRKVASFCQLLKEDYGGQLDETADTYIEYAVDGARRMKELIDDLLEFSRVGRRQLDTEPVDVASVVEVVLGNLDAVRADAAVHIGDLPVVMAERPHLMQLYQNLLSNALKFRSPDRACIVRVDAERGTDEWVFSVSDNGIGLDPRHAERIFQVFQRLHTREEYPGTGIGLAICRRIVDRLGGSIWVQSTPGQGSTFRWTMPHPSGSGGTIGPVEQDLGPGQVG